MPITVHFKVKKVSAADLEARLGDLGFDSVRALPDSNRVVLFATEEELTSQLGLVIERENREKVVGFHKTRTSESIVSDSSSLPLEIADLIESCYTPIAPDRQNTSR